VKNRHLLLVMLILAIFVMSATVGAQEISEKKDIAVFSLSYTDWNIPSGALGLVDQSIQNVLVDLGRFNIYGMTYRLEGNDIQTFIDKIKEYKEENIEIPEEVRLGQATFTEADFNRLVGSFIVVIPVMSFYDVQYDNGEYEASIQTSFTFVNVDEGTALAGFQIDTSGSGDSEREAVKEAVDAIPMQLQFRIRSVPEFQLKTGIIDIVGRDYIIEFGRNMGVKMGDEYSIMETRVLPSGRQFTDETGLMVIKTVDSEISAAQVLYSKGRPAIGSQLQEIPRMGFDLGGYFHLLNSPDVDESIVGVAGLRAVASRGFFSIRPVTGVEIPLGDSFLIWFPVNYYIGAEANWMLGRFSLNPSVVVGAGFLIPIIDNEDFEFLSSIGFTGLVEANYLLTRDIKLFARGGYTFYKALIFPESNPNDYNGVVVGGGLSYKF
jgi:hypothetical protein